MQETTLDKEFQKLISYYSKNLEDNIIGSMHRSKNKVFAHDKLLNNIRSIQRRYSRGMQAHQKACNLFIEKYNLGESLESILKQIISKYPESLKIELISDERETVLEIDFTDGSSEIITKFLKENQNLISFFAGLFSLEEIVKRFPEYLNQETKKTFPFKSKIKYTPSNKENKTEFVQLVYGMYEAGLINSGKGEITKIVEELSVMFGVDLGKNWQSNHSSSIHKSNKGYSPEVFDKIKQAYLNYSHKQTEKKKKNI